MQRARGWLIVTLLVSVILLGGCDVADEGAPLPARVAHDLLQIGDWEHFAGAEVQPDGSLFITALDRRIVEQDASGGQPNPPVNLRGPRLEVDGDFTVDVTMNGIGNEFAYLHLYSAMPVIYDEWRREPPSIRLGVRSGDVELAIWDGNSDDPGSVETFASTAEDHVDLTVRIHAGEVSVWEEAERLGSIPDPGLFGSLVWLGADAEEDGDWTLSALSVSGEGGDDVRILAAPSLQQATRSDTLRELAGERGRPIDIGTALAAGPLFADEEYRSIAGSSFSMLTPENDFKPQFVQPRRGVFAFEEGDALVEFAEANDMVVHAHTLVWHEALPQWMRDDATGVTMDAHIDAVAGHFRSDVAEWDVVNEPMSDDDEDYRNGNLGLRSDSPWFASMGEEYIDRAFRRAHLADPDATLFINEYGVEEDGPRWDALLALVERLVDRGVPIGGVGFQNHEYELGDRGTAETFRKHAAVLADLGLEVRVSEMDVLVDEGEKELQAEEFANSMRTCLEAENCTSFSTWGFTDLYGSTADVGEYPPELGDALPWDAHFQRKPAHVAMLEVLGDKTE